MCESPAQAEAGKSLFLTAESTAPTAKPAREQRDLAARWAASPQAPQTRARGDPPGEPGSPGAVVYPASATLGKGIKPCVRFSAPTPREINCLSPNKLIVPWWDCKYVFM